MDADYEKNLTTPTDAGPQFRPANSLMIVMGVIVILGGVVLLALGWAAGFVFPGFLTETAGFEDSPLIEIIKIYQSMGITMGLVGIGFLILGIGSIRLRKWARKLLLAWGWMLIGFCGMMLISMLIMIPSMVSMMESMGAVPAGVAPTPVGPGGTSVGGPSASSAGGMAFSLAFIIGMIFQLVFYLVIIGGPGALLILIYKRKNVELTTRYYHQAACWTDGKPIPVLILWLFYVLGILVMIPMFFGYVEASVILGVIPSAKIGNIFLAVFIAVLAILSFGIARLASWSWWGSLGYLLACGCLGYYMYSSFDMASFNEKLYALSAIDGADDDEALKEMQASMAEYQNKSMQIGMLSGGIIWMGFIGYLFWIRKHFFPKGNEPTGVAAT